MNFGIAKRFLGFQKDKALLFPDEIFLTTLHQKLFMGDIATSNAGKFKTSRNFVRIAGNSVRNYSEPEEVREHLKHLNEECLSLHDQICRLSDSEQEEAKRLSAIFIAHYHAKFIQIHPFDGGNGRLARMLAFEQRRILFNGVEYDEQDISDKKRLKFNSFSRSGYLAAMNRADEDLSHLIRCLVPGIDVKTPTVSPFGIKYKRASRPKGAP